MATEPNSLDADYERLLGEGYTQGPISPPLGVHTNLPPSEARWLREEATPWWEGITARAQRDRLSVWCYRGVDEYVPWDTPCAALLHPHTSVDRFESHDLDPRRLGEGEQLLDAWRRVAAAPWPGDLPEVAADYEQLRRRGGVTAPGRRHPFLPVGPESQDERRRSYAVWLQAVVVPWCAALTRRARQDGRSLYCTFSSIPAYAALLDPRTGRTLDELAREAGSGRAR